MWRDGPYIRETHLHYDPEPEQARWNLTRQIIERADPGPFEDPIRLETLARQAASVELALRPPHAQGSIPAEALSHVILGSTSEPRSEAYSAPAAGVVVILFSSGMMQFIHECSKALVLAWKAEQPPPESTVSFSEHLEDTDEVLNINPYPANLFRDTLLSWLYEGRPRCSASVPPDPDRAIPTDHLTHWAERFVLAHEYGHALNHLLNTSDRSSETSVQAKAPPEWGKEFAADHFAIDTIIRSSMWLDNVRANMALQGAVVAMKTHEIFDRELSPYAPTTNPVLHPPFSQRIAALEQMYVGTHPYPDEAPKDLVGMVFPGMTLDRLWACVAPDLRKLLHSGRPLHPIWSER